MYKRYTRDKFLKFIQSWKFPGNISIFNLGKWKLAFNYTFCSVINWFYFSIAVDWHALIASNLSWKLAFKEKYFLSNSAISESFSLNSEPNLSNSFYNSSNHCNQIKMSYFEFNCSTEFSNLVKTAFTWPCADFISLIWSFLSSPVVIQKNNKQSVLSDIAY